MHIILGILGSVITILILLNRLAEAGIDLGGFNPFLWHRRRQWQKKLQGNPIYQVDNPLDLTALLATATVKADGDMSAEEKRTLLELFQSEFKLSKREAAELLIASAFLLGKGDELNNHLDKVMQPSLANFTAEQAESAVGLLQKVSVIDPRESEFKLELVSSIKKVLQQQFQPKGKWE